MSEEQIVQATPVPRTRASLLHDLRQLGVEAGMTILVHSSLRSLGWVSGGPVAVVHALMDAVTPAGAIMVPTQTPGYSDPAHWQTPPVPADWWPTIYETMPAYDPAITPTEHMGKIVEVFRTWPGVLRSAHPNVSFAAWGRSGQDLTKDHPLEYGLGERSPIARLYDLDGWVLMLGTGYEPPPLSTWPNIERQGVSRSRTVHRSSSMGSVCGSSIVILRLILTSSLSLEPNSSRPAR